MVRVQRIQIDGFDDSWTVLGDNHLPIVPVEMFLEHLRQTGASPNTVKSYSRALELWWRHLALRGRTWESFALEDLTAFLAWLRNGLPPGVAALGETPALVSDATLAIRLQGVRSFYIFHQWRGVEVPVWLFSGRPARAPYTPFLGHLTRNHPHRAVTVRVRRRRRSAPTLTPTQIQLIKDCCARYDPVLATWTGSVRDRLFFALLEETGLRLGEALCLQHRDWHSGQGENPFIEVTPRPHPHGARVKGGNYRKIYISGELDRLYAEYVWQVCDQGMDLSVPDMDSAWIFVNLRGGRRFAPIRPETIYKLVNRIRRTLGDQVPSKWSPHWFRHTHATALLLSGRPVHAVSRRLGHADVQTTLNTYAWVTEDDELRALAEWKGATETWRTGYETS